MCVTEKVKRTEAFFFKDFTLNNLFQHQKHEGKHKQRALAYWVSWTDWFNVIVAGFAAS